MRAAVIDRFGGPEEFHIADLPVPTPGPGEVLVKVAAAGVNPLDYKIRDGSSGMAKNIAPEDFPYVLGRECCGDVVEVGEGVDPEWGLTAGTRVFGMAPLEHGGHCYAEYVALPA